MIDDGSRDETWQIISDLHTQDPVFSGIRLSRNRGHQNALLCGLMTLRDRADCVISMDADLQDDINAIDAMLAAFRDGNDIVYGAPAVSRTLRSSAPVRRGITACCARSARTWCITTLTTGS